MKPVFIKVTNLDDEVVCINAATIEQMKIGKAARGTVIEREGLMNLFVKESLDDILAQINGAVA